ncbi:MAG: TetR/AcrR family transcriptional regulator [Myxococcaceae bacterium]|jgi:AcrR family transcriptional regulator|nr:TetR/AcrR family transcriptional regulator [Myxococcaceae bacterium]
MTTDLKSQVLEASVQLIAEQGLAGLSMREVARRAGVSHQAPYHYFDDKAAIVAALVERGFTLLSERMEAAAHGSSPGQKLERAGHAYVTFALDEPVYFRLMFRPELTDLRRFPGVEAAGARAYAVLERLVDEHAPRAAQAKRDAMVSMHWSLVHGLATLLVDGPLGAEFPDAAARTRHVEQVIKLFATSF